VLHGLACNRQQLRLCGKHAVTSTDSRAEYPHFRPRTRRMRTVDGRIVCRAKRTID
jgi:hypothetical protein